MFYGSNNVKSMLLSQGESVYLTIFIIFFLLLVFRNNSGEEHSSPMLFIITH